MRLSEFIEEVRKEFGPRLERATPAGMQEFVLRMQAQLSPPPAKGERLELDDHARSFEEVYTDFFGRVLDFAPDQAVIMLWLLAAELYFSRLEEQYEYRFAPLFQPEDL